MKREKTWPIYCHRTAPHRTLAAEKPFRFAPLLAALLAAFPPVALAQTSGITDLGAINGGTSSSANGVNSDGSVVVGEANDGAAGATRAFRWTQASGLVSLGMLNGGLSARAYGVNGDGSVVVGDARDGAAGNAFRAFRWTQASRAC